MKRRIFIKDGLIGLGVALLPQTLCLSQSYNDYPYRSLNEAFRAMAFDPYKKGTAYFTVTADVHYGSAGDGMGATVKEVNLMDPKPAFFCVNGDLIVSGSRSFGAVPDVNERRQAIKELSDFKADAAKLNPDIPLKLTLGNHDTHPKEVDPLMFWEVFPEYRPYQSLDLEGVHIIFLNGHSTGYIDPVQEKWLRNDVQNISNETTVIILVHQPSMSHRVRERGIPEVISNVFDNHHGVIWLIGGHEHTNDQKIFRLKKTKLIEHHITCGTINIWGGPEKPGYWIYCLDEGRVFGRVYRQRSAGYRLEPNPKVKYAQEVPKPFDHTNNILWRIMVGEGDREYLVKSNAEDCLNYWAYVKELIYCVPLEENNNEGRRIGLLTDHRMENINRNGQYFISSNMKDWQEIRLSANADDVLIFEMPKIFISRKRVYFRFTPSGEAAVGGLALLS